MFFARMPVPLTIHAAVDQQGCVIFDSCELRFRYDRQYVEPSIFPAFVGACPASLSPPWSVADVTPTGTNEGVLALYFDGAAMTQRVASDPNDVLYLKMLDHATHQLALQLGPAASRDGDEEPFIYGDLVLELSLVLS